jgi:hypothetical protein
MDTRMRDRESIVRDPDRLRAAAHHKERGAQPQLAAGIPADQLGRRIAKLIEQEFFRFAPPPRV